jgi:hypothetical protein
LTDTTPEEFKAELGKFVRKREALAGEVPSKLYNGLGQDEIRVANEYLRKKLGELDEELKDYFESVCREEVASREASPGGGDERED